MLLQWCITEHLVLQYDRLEESWACYEVLYLLQTVGAAQHCYTAVGLLRVVQRNSIIPGDLRFSHPDSQQAAHKQLPMYNQGTSENSSLHS